MCLAAKVCEAQLEGALAAVVADHVVVIGDVAERAVDHRARNAGLCGFLLEIAEPRLETVRVTAAARGLRGGRQRRRDRDGHDRRYPNATLHPLISWGADPLLRPFGLKIRPEGGERSGRGLSPLATAGRFRK